MHYYYDIVEIAFAPVFLIGRGDQVVVSRAPLSV